MESGSTEELVRRYQAGIDPEASFERIFRRHRRLVRYYFRRRGCSPEEVDDLVQETFLRVLRGIHQFRHEARFETWLLKVAASAFSDMIWKRPGVGRSLQEIPVEDIETEVQLHGTSLMSESVDPHRRAVVREQARAVRAVVMEMPLQMQRCVALRITQSLRYREIAEVLQVSLDVVRVQLFRARKRLKKKLDGSAGQLRI